MENIPDDELISAYLDGELTGKDLARAEQLLASQADSRQMLEELTALRATLKSLPQHTLGPDFADSVLRRAEREMLQPAAGGASLPDPVDTWRPEVPPILSTSRWARPLIWSALATAAAIMVMMFSPPDAQKKVAMAPAPQVAAGPAVLDQKFEARVERAPADGNLAAKAQGAPAQAEPMIGKISPDAQSTAGTGAAAPGAGGPGAGAADAVQGGFFAGNSALSRGAVADQALAPTDEMHSADVGALLVVRCDVTPEVARSASFRKLLAEQQIPWQEEVRSRSLPAKRLNATTEQDKVVRSEPKADKERASGFESEDGKEIADKAGAAREGADSAVADAEKPSPAASDTEAVYVVAAPAQVDAAIAAISHNAEFRNFQVTEVASPIPTEVFEEIGERRDVAVGALSVDDKLSASGGGQAEDQRSSENLSKKDDMKKSGVASPMPLATPAPAAAAASAPAPSAPAAAEATDAAAPAAAPAIAPYSLRSGKPRGADTVQSSPQKNKSNETLRDDSGASSLMVAQPSMARAMPVPISAEAIAALSRAADEAGAGVLEDQPRTAADSAAADAKGDRAEKDGEQKQELGKSEAPAVPKPQQTVDRLQEKLGNVKADEGMGVGGMGGGKVAPAKSKPPAETTPTIRTAPPAPAANALSGSKSTSSAVKAPAPSKISPADPSGADRKAQTRAKSEAPAPPEFQDAPPAAADSAAADAAGPDSATDDSKQSAFDVQQYGESAVTQKGVAPKRALFLFRVVPAPAVPR